MRVFDVKDGRQVGLPFRAGDRPESVVHTALNHDGRRALAVYADGNVRIWDADSASPASTAVALSIGDVIHAAFNPKGTFVVTGGSDRTARVWDAVSGKAVGKPLNHPGEVLILAFDGDGHLITVCPSASRDEELQVHTWDFATQAEIFPAQRYNPEPNIVDLAVAADGEVLLIVEQKAESTGERLKARLWQVDAGGPASAPVSLDATAPADGNDRVIRVQASPLGREGRRFRVVTVAAGADGRRARARLFDPVEGRVVAELEQYDEVPGSKFETVQARFSLDGLRLATLIRTTDLAPHPAGASPPKLKLWDAETGAKLADGPPLDFSASDFTFDDSGRLLVVWGFELGGNGPAVGPLNGRAVVIDANSRAPSRSGPDRTADLPGRTDSGGRTDRMCRI